MRTGREPKHLSEADELVVEAVRLVARGKVAAGLSAWESASKDLAAVDPTVRARAQTLFRRVKGESLERSLPPPPPPLEPASPAWALAWAGDLAGARRLAEAQPEGPDTWAVLGAIHGLERRPAAALRLLDRALASGGAEPVVLHRVRALVHLGRLSEAERALTRLVDGESFPRRVAVALVSLKRGRLGLSFRRWRARALTSEYVYNGMFSTELPAVVEPQALARGLESREALASLLDGLLDRMAGNLGPDPTFAETTADGARRYVRLSLPPLPRNRARSALDSLRHTTPEDTESRLDALVREPRPSVHAYTYRGELYLWLGRYEEAWRDFVAAWRTERVRWADVGMVAVLTMTGRLRRAQITAFYAANHFGSRIQGATLPVYRGMLRRRLRDYGGAIADLRAAIDVKPGRVGARIELVLALRAAGRASEATSHAAIVASQAAPLLADAAEAMAVPWREDPARLVDDEVLEEALRAMRGNRSSHLITWFDRQGAFRVLRPVAELVERAGQTLEGIGVGAA